MQEEVRSQDSVFVIASVSMNPKGRDLTWEFFKSNWAVLLERYQVTIGKPLLNSTKMFEL